MSLEEAQGLCYGIHRCTAAVAAVTVAVEAAVAAVASLHPHTRWFFLAEVQRRSAPLPAAQSGRAEWAPPLVPSLQGHHQDRFSNTVITSRPRILVSRTGSSAL